MFLGKAKTFLDFIVNSRETFATHSRVNLLVLYN